MDSHDINDKITKICLVPTGHGAGVRFPSGRIERIRLIVYKSTRNNHVELCIFQDYYRPLSYSFVNCLYQMNQRVF